MAPPRSRPRARVANQPFVSTDRPWNQTMIATTPMLSAANRTAWFPNSPKIAPVLRTGQIRT